MKALAMSSHPLAHHSVFRRHRLWLPVGLIVLAVAVSIAVQVQVELERNFKAWMTLIIVLLAAVLNLLWYLTLSRIPWRRRFRGFAVLALAGGAAAVLLRVHGSVDGRGLPRLVWRWTKSEPALVQAPAVSGGAVSNDPRLAQLADVPQFFGPQRDGIVRGAKLARDWKASPIARLQPITGRSKIRIRPGSVPAQRSAHADAPSNRRSIVPRRPRDR